MELIKFILAEGAGVHLSRRQIKLINGMELWAGGRQRNLLRNYVAEPDQTLHFQWRKSSPLHKQHFSSISFTNLMNEMEKCVCCAKSTQLAVRFIDCFTRSTRSSINCRHQLEEKLKKIERLFFAGARKRWKQGRGKGNWWNQLDWTSAAVEGPPAHNPPTIQSNQTPPINHSSQSSIVFRFWFGLFVFLDLLAGRHSIMN